MSNKSTEEKSQVKINALEFLKHWEDFSLKFTELNSDWQDAYKLDITWSNLFLGGKRSSSEHSPIGNYFSEKLNLRFRKEDGLFDLAFSSAENIKGIKYLYRGTENSFNIEDQFYPTSYDIIIEIENNPSSSWQEMAKLTWVNCPLKVLITYYNEEKNDLEAKVLIHNFSNIIKNCNSKFQENNKTEYLLLIGRIENDKLIWDSFIFNTQGNEIDKNI